MSLSVCIPDLIAQGKIDPKYADQVRQIYDDLVREYEPHMGRSAAEATATKQAIAAWEKEIKTARRQRLANLNQQANILKDVTTGYRRANSNAPINGEAMLAIFARDQRATYPNVEYIHAEVKGVARGMFYDVLKEHRPDLLGRVRHKADLDDLVREVHGQDSGNENAKVLADAWRRTAEYLRERFNQAGGAIPKLEDWGLPHSHDPMRVGAVPAAQWVSEMLADGVLDRARMIDRMTGAPLSDAKLQLLLHDIYERIVSDGAVDRVPGRGGSRMLANRHAEQRILHFKDADAWLAYNDRYGRADPFSAMQGHINGRSRDIALMERLGPNPDQTVKWMKDVLDIDAKKRGNVGDIERASSYRYKIDRFYGTFTGELQRPENVALANFGSAVRSWQSLRLGTAVFTSLSDHATSALTRKFNGLKAITTLSDMVRDLDPRAGGSIETIRRTMILGDEYAGHMNNAGRFIYDDMTGGRLADGQSRIGKAMDNGAEITRRAADGFLRSTGLNHVTQVRRDLFQKEVYATLAEQRGKPWDQLDRALQWMFQRYGMDAGAWDHIRAIEPDRSHGFGMILPQQLNNEALARRIRQMVAQEADYAIPSGGLRQRAIIGGAGRPGTLMGELARTGFQFKMFSTTVTMMHVARMIDLAQERGAWSPILYGIGLVGGTTILGALSLQLYEMLNGRNPRDMTRWEFYKDAALKGGGLGQFGDTINAAMSNQYGQGLGDMVAGPAWSSIQANVDFVGGKPRKNAVGDTVRNHDLAGFLERETPGSSHWMARLAIQRLLIDHIRDATDDRAEEHYRRMEKYQRDKGGSYWWRPGRSVPDGPPDLGAAWPVDESAPKP